MRSAGAPPVFATGGAPPPAGPAGGAEGMVHHPIAIRGSGDQPPFWVADFELPVGARRIGEGLQFLLQLEEIGLQMFIEGQHIGAVALAALGAAGGGVEGSEAGDLGVEIGEGSGHICG